MRLLDLFESPIGDIRTLNWDEPGTFRRADQKLMQSPKHITRIRKAFEKTPYVFDIVMWNQPGLSYLRNAPTGNNALGITKQKFNPRFISDIAGKSGFASPSNLRFYNAPEVQPKPGVITLISGSNADASKTPMPLTPWIIAHRFAHGLTDMMISYRAISGKPKEQQSDDENGYIKHRIDSNTTNEWRTAIGTLAFYLQDHPRLPYRDPNGKLSEFQCEKPLFRGLRARRVAAIADVREVDEEAIAAFLIHGVLDLNPEVFIPEKPGLGLMGSWHDPKNEKENFLLLKKAIAKESQAMTKLTKMIVDHCVGKVILAF